MEVQNHNKKRSTKKNVLKGFCKKIDKTIQNLFSRFFYYVFGRFSVGESKNTAKPISFKKDFWYLALVIFWPLAHPPTTDHGGHRICFVPAPCWRARHQTAVYETYN
jgi:hypothetical protein